MEQSVSAWDYKIRWAQGGGGRSTLGVNVIVSAAASTPPPPLAPPSLPSSFLRSRSLRSGEKARGTPP